MNLKAMSDTTISPQMVSDGGSEPHAVVTIWDIFLQFLIIGATSFGGVVPYLREALVTRLGWLDDKLEVAEDLYELANDRLSDFTYFHREFRLELLIVVLLLAEVIIMSAELWWMVRHP